MSVRLTEVGKGLAAIGLAILAFLGAAYGEAPLSPTEAAQRLLEEIRSATGTPAVSGAVARRGQLVFTGGSGLADVEHGAPADGGTVYNIGSVSKVITAVAILQLVDQGRVSLDDDIREWVAEFPDKGAPITLWNLLTHTSGIRHYRPTDFPGTPDNENIHPLTWRQGLDLFANDPLLFPPGRYFFYSSYAVNLLQGVVERASGASFENYLREHVFEPSGMARASFDVPGEVASNRAVPYRIVKGTPERYYYNDLRYKFASGGMIASVEDLVMLGAALNRGILLQPETKAAMFSNQIPSLPVFVEDAKPAAPMRWEQGLLWRLRRDAQGRRVAYECGSVRASNACVVIFIDEDLVAAIATNSWECCGWAAADKLAALFRESPASQ
jgi:CubicO group peptidase (beta-lactamase class C family)